MLQSPNLKYERSPSPQTEYNRYLNPGDLSGHVGKYDYSPSDKHCTLHFPLIYLAMYQGSRLSRRGSPVRSRLYMDPQERAEQDHYAREEYEA